MSAAAREGSTIDPAEVSRFDAMAKSLNIEKIAKTFEDDTE